MPPAVIAVVESEPTNPEDWYAHVLNQAFERQRPLRALVLSGAPQQLADAGVPSACAVRFGNGAEPRWASLVCRPPSLPFQVDCFDLVILHELVNQGDERLLATVRRSMPGGSHLLVLGRARFSARRLGRRTRAKNAFRPGWLSRRLRLMGFVTKDLRGRGVGGIDLSTGQGWRKSLLGCSDRVALRARRSEARHDIRLVRFSSPKVATPTAAWDSANREAAP